MTDNWKSYFCRVNDTLSSIRFNLGLCGDAPIRSKSWLLWVWVYFRTPRPDGLSDNKEAPTLFKIEDGLTPELSRRCGAIPCGAITTQGRREFYFYGDTREDFDAAVVTSLANFPDYEFDKGDKHDPRWEQYFQVLYPSPEDMQRIANRDLLEELEKRGDVLSVKREVLHWIYFKTKRDRDRFKETVAKSGYRIDFESESDVQGDRPLGLTVARIHSVEQEVVDEIAVELLHFARQFDGEYDGWETPVVNQ